MKKEATIRARAPVYFAHSNETLFAERRPTLKRVAAEHYVYALTDYREVDRTIALARVQNR
jgi:hypothetical protein